MRKHINHSAKLKDTSLVQALAGSVTELKDKVARLELECDELKIDSGRWHAFLNSPIRVLGWAGLDAKNPTLPSEHGEGGYAHFGCEIWTKHSGYLADRKDLLIGFADQAIRAQAKEGVK